MAKRPPKDPFAPTRAEKVKTASDQRAKKARNTRIGNGVVIGSVVVGLVAAAVIYKKHHHSGPAADPTVTALKDIGQSPFVAGCAQNGLFFEDAVVDGDKVVPTGEMVKYHTVPPSAGPHQADPVNVKPDGFYTGADRPPVEQLVSNLNAGWTVVWYDARTLGPQQVALIQKATGILRNDPRYNTFLAVEWDSTYGPFPEGTPIALVRWTKTGDKPAGHRAFCHEVSGTAFLQYMTSFGAPEAAGEADE